MIMNSTKVALAAVALWAGTALAAGPKTKIAPELKTADSHGRIRVIVQFESAVNQGEDELAIVRQGGQLEAKFRLMRTSVYTLPVAAIDALSQRRNVKYISPDRSSRALLDYTAPTVGATWARQAGWTGAGLAVAVIDSGISPSRDLDARRILYSESFAVGKRGGSDPYGHGTHIAGAIGGNGQNSGGTFTGIAPEVLFVDLRVLDKDGAGTDSADDVSPSASILRAGPDSAFGRHCPRAARSSMVRTPSLTVPAGVRLSLARTSGRSASCVPALWPARISRCDAGWLAPADASTARIASLISPRTMAAASESPYLVQYPIPPRP